MCGSQYEGFGKIACQDDVSVFQRDCYCSPLFYSQVNGEEGGLEVEDIRHPLEQGYSFRMGGALFKLTNSLSSLESMYFFRCIHSCRTELCLT